MEHDGTLRPTQNSEVAGSDEAYRNHRIRNNSISYFGSGVSEQQQIILEKSENKNPKGAADQKPE